MQILGDYYETNYSCKTETENVNVRTGTTLISPKDSDVDEVLRRVDDALHNQCSYE